MVSIEDVQQKALQKHQLHRQLSMREAEMISLELLELLCDDECENQQCLQYVCRLMTPESYQDLVDERNLNKKCGYPLCSRPPERIRDPFSMDANTRKFLWENNPYAYLSSYCSKLHFKASQFLLMQLSQDALFTRTGIHLFTTGLDPFHSDNEKNEQYNVTLFEQLLSKRASQEDIKALIAGLKSLGINNGQEEEKNNEIDGNLSQWLSEFTVVENENPSEFGDLLKD